MRHRRRRHRLDRDGQHRRAMLGNMAASLIKHEQITTTLPKAKALRPFIERLVTAARHGGLHQRRLVLGKLRDHPSAVKLFSELAVRYKDRPGGYTRIMRAGFRYGDNAPRAVIEFVERNEAAKGLDSGPSESSTEISA